MKTLFHIDRIILGIATIGISGAILPLLFGQENFDYVTGNPRYEMALAFCYGLGGLLALRYFHQTLAVAGRSRPLVAAILLAFASVLWAENPGLAIRRALALSGCTMVGVLLAMRLTSAERLRFLSILLRILTASSLVFAVFLPQYGISSEVLQPEGWIGVFNQKNGLGSCAALAFLVDSFLPGTIRSRLPWFALYALLLLKSNSISPLIALLAAWILVFLFDRLRRRHKFSVRAIFQLLTAGVAVCVTVGLGSGFFQAALRRSVDLTGRGQLWRALVPAIMMHPFLGYGYGAFWSGGSQENYEVVRKITWDPMYSHSGYIEVIVSLGLAGLFLACWILFQGVYRSVLISDSRESLEGLFPLALMFYFLVGNISEVTLLYHNCLEWAVFVATLLAVLPGSPDLVRDESTDVEEGAQVPVEELA